MRFDFAFYFEREFNKSIYFVEFFFKFLINKISINFIQQEADELGEDKKLKIIKKKSPAIEENKSKKEHVNVVFIGHVGRC